MKKNIIYSIGAWLTAMCLFSCSADMDVQLEKDNTANAEPYTTINQYAVGKGLNPDNDTQLRFSFNTCVDKAYYIVELVADKKKYVEENGDAAYLDYVVENGTEITYELETRSADVTLTGLIGENEITVVSVNSNGQKKANSIFFTGLSWLDVCSGTYYTSVLTPMGIPATIADKKLQVCESDPNLYRIVDLYKAGNSIKFKKIENKGIGQNGSEYNFIRVEMQPVGLNYGDYGPVYIQDIGYWQGDDSFVLSGGYQGGIYADNNVFLYVEYCVALGNLGYNYEYFVPNVE